MYVYIYIYIYIYIFIYLYIYIYICIFKGYRMTFFISPPVSRLSEPNQPTVDRIRLIKALLSG